MKRLIQASRFLHKVLGLALCAFLMWMSLSGIVLNHPKMVAHCSVPKWLVPQQYHPRNWSRSAMKTVVFSRSSPDTAYVSGHMGIWKSEDGGQSFTDFNTGLPASRYLRKTHSFIAVEGELDVLFAGTTAGLYRRPAGQGAWQRIDLPTNRPTVKRILLANGRLLVFTDSEAFSSPSIYGNMPFRRVSLTRQTQIERVSWVDLVFDLHGGAIWGLPGRLLIDVTGLIIFFLSLTGFYCWLFKKRLKRKSRRFRPKSKRAFRFMWAYHKLLGIWVAVFLFLIAGTGMFMRPPLLGLLVDVSLPRSGYPGPLPDNPWAEKIHNACFDATTGNLLVEASDGVWEGSLAGVLEGPLDGTQDQPQVFNRITLPAPIFVMGATVFQCDNRGALLVGSFSGLFAIDHQRTSAQDLVFGRAVTSTSSSRPSPLMITSYFETPQGQSFFATHYGGLRPLSPNSCVEAFPMPEALSRSYRMPLWNFLFELHNGRIFRDWVGDLYILIIPLCAFLTVIITLSGVFDWIAGRKRKSPAAR